MTNFADIKTIFNRAMAASQAKVGKKDLKGRHAETSFPDFYGNFTNAELKAGMARGRRLIQPELLPAIGTVGNKGDQANIILALRGTLTGFRQMPAGGPPMPAADIAIVVDWINHGCPD